MSKLIDMSSSTTHIQSRRATSRGASEHGPGEPAASRGATSGAAASRGDAERSGAAIGPAFAALVLAMLPAVLDQTVLATALPTIAGELGTIADVSTLVTVYVLAATATTPVWGKLGDRHGRRNLLAGALSLFLLASACCGVAQDLTQLLVARTV